MDAVRRKEVAREEGECDATQVSEAVEEAKEGGEKGTLGKGGEAGPGTVKEDKGVEGRVEERNGKQLLLSREEAHND